MELKQNLCFVLAIITLVLIWKAVKYLWLRPKQIEKILRNQGLQGSPYKPLIGDAIDLIKITRELSLKPINLSDDPLPRILAFIHHIITKFGKNCFAWIGPVPWLIITDPEYIKEVLRNYQDFRKPDQPMAKLLLVGLFNEEGEKWAKHRKIINPAFHMEKLKYMCAAMNEGCSSMINSWEKHLSDDGSTELDVCPFLEDLAGDLISRVAFSSSYEEGKTFFNLQREYVKLGMSIQPLDYIPGWKFIPTKRNRRLKKITQDIEELCTKMIESRKKEMEGGESTKNDLLGILLESNMREIKENINDMKSGLTTRDVVRECRLFYLAGSDTSTSLLSWSLVLLSKHQIWQDRAREEILQVFGKDTLPNFDGLSRLKIMTMILYEVLRLYTPTNMLMRKVYKDTELGELIIPAGTELILPTSFLHQDCNFWGEDAKEFNPERFAKGVAEATKGQPIFYPFSGGPRICIGKEFALLEAKLILTMILQRFSFQLSPTYVHAPHALLTMKPQFGANLILRKLHC